MAGLQQDDDTPAPTGKAAARSDRRVAGKTDRGQDHHFMPCFHLDRWARGKQRRLCEFKVRHELVRPRWTSPSGTGYVTLLYGLAEGP